MAGIQDPSLRDRLLALMRAGADRPLDDDAFDALARDVFAYQFATNPIYAAYCRRRGVAPDTLDHWTAVPALPTAAFKEARLVSGDAAAADVVFRTSGTTRGRERRGEHVVLDLELYRASLVPTFRAFLLADDAAIPLLSLVPTREAQPDSSLSFMVSTLIETVGAEGSGFFVTPSHGLAADRLLEALREAARERRPVALLGTTLAFVHLLERMQESDERLELPEGSRLMDTGGFKGRRRQVDPAAIAELYERFLGVPRARQVNEYGMTEMCSQMYDVALRDVAAGREPRAAKAGPPWLRTLVVDPETLEPVPAGDVGILQHHDLANLGSVAAVQTEDLGREVDGGFELLGRAAGAPPRGCSIALDMLLEELGRA